MTFSRKPGGPGAFGLKISSPTLSKGVGVPALPPGFAFSVFDDGAYAVDDNGNFYIVEA